MSHQLIDLNPVLQKLLNEGFDIEVRGQYLWVHRVPYINANMDIASGTLVMNLDTSGDKVLAPGSHTAFWIGEQPRFKDGTFIPSLVNSPKKENLGNNIYSDYFLSCMPDNNRGRYLDYYDKVSTYYHMISDAAFLFAEVGEVPLLHVLQEHFIMYYILFTRVQRQNTAPSPLSL